MIIPELGLFSLIVAFCLAGLLASGIRFDYKDTLRGIFWVQTGTVILGFATLVLCFMQNNFSVEYVALNSNTKLPILYKLCAVWGAHEGSLLLWIVILSGWMMAIMGLKHERVIIILGAISASFLFLLLHTSNPFSRLLPVYPEEGIDLNPLLQDFGFVIHPPFLYLGYVGFAVPFAYSITALIQKDQTETWLPYARAFALMAWGCLTIGMVLGSWWAYYELGWGGWWFWDPVENASLMPWLMGGALCHALQVSSERKQFLAWTHVLAISTFILSLMGTFLVRSGMISSVHAFASDPKRGSYIFGFILAVSLLSFGLYFTRIRTGKINEAPEMFSRTSGMILGNIILVVMMLTVLLGTLYPLAMEVLLQKRLSVGAPYFKTMFIPLVCLLMLLMGIVPYLNWQDNTWKIFEPRLKWLLWAGITVLGGGSVLFLDNAWLTVGGVLLGMWLITVTLLRALVLKRAIRWGMMLAHAGVGVAIIGMTLVNAWETEKEIVLPVGGSFAQGKDTFIFQDLNEYVGANFEGIKGHFIIQRPGKKNVDLFPEKRYFPARQLAMTETAIEPGFFKDYYLSLGEPLEENQWSVRIYIKPFVRWVWLGGILIAMGALFSGMTLYNQLRKQACKQRIGSTS